MKRRVVLSISAVLGAVLIALLSTGVLSSSMFSLDRWIAWAALATWTQGIGYIYPTTTTDSVIVGANSVGGADHILDASGSATFNEQGADADFRVEGDNNANLICTDAGNDYVGIGTATPSYWFTVRQGGGATLGGITDTAFALYNNPDTDSDVRMLLASGATGKCIISLGATSQFNGTLEFDSATQNLNVSANDDVVVSADTTNLNSGQQVKRTAVSGTYTVLLTDYYLGINASSGVTLNLPTVASAGTGREYLLVIESGGSNVTLDGNSGEDVNGGDTAVVSGEFSIRHLVCNDTAWIVDP